LEKGQGVHESVGEGGRAGFQGEGDKQKRKLGKEMGKYLKEGHYRFYHGGSEEEHAPKKSGRRELRA